MPDSKSKPVALLIYANTGPELAKLEAETETIKSLLTSSDLCEIKTVPAATLQDVVNAINEPALRDRVAIVHYAGHADGSGIQLRSSSGAPQGEIAYMRGLAQILATQPHLRLVFINGCASREQVLELTQAGIPLVIATNQGIEDSVAYEFAKGFYGTLGQQRSIADAFQVAAGIVKSASGGHVRGLYSGKFKESPSATKDQLPWELHGPDVDRHWSLHEPFYRGTGPRWDHTKFRFNEESPYVGLKYFDEAESSRFFGRDDFVETLLGASESAPLILVVGASGSGKSSVVRAGMFPQWRKRHRNPDGRVIVFTPQDDPFDQFATALGAIDTFDRQKVRAIREKPSRTSLRDAVTTFRKNESWLIFIDQFEQIFTRTTDKAKRIQFLDAIADLGKSENPNFCLILAMRDDFFPQLRDYPELFPLTDKHFFRIATLNRAALREVIERPAAEHGVAFQPGLVDKIIEDVDRQPGELPLLQYSLDALWKEEDLSDRLLNSTTYHELGGVTGSLGRRLQTLYDQQDAADKDQFRWMMLKLVTYDENASGSGAVSRLAPKSEFEGKQSELLDQLIFQGLVVSSGTAIPSIQLGHEKLIEAWPEFTRWTQEYREANHVRRQLGKAADDWKGISSHEHSRKSDEMLLQGAQLAKAIELRQRGDFEQLGGLTSIENEFLQASYDQSQKQTRRLKKWLATASALAVVAITLAGTSWWYYSEAKTNEKQATDNAIQSQTNEKKANDNAAIATSNATDARRQEANAYWQLAVTDREQNNGIAASFKFLRSAQASNEAFILSRDKADFQQRYSSELAAQFASKHLVSSTPLYFPSGALAHDKTRSRFLFSSFIERTSFSIWRLENAITEKEASLDEPGFGTEVLVESENRIISFDRNGIPKILNAERLSTCRHPSEVSWTIFNETGTRVVSLDDEGTLRLWDATKETPLIKEWKPGRRSYWYIGFTGDGTRFITVSVDLKVNLWDITMDKPALSWELKCNSNGAVFLRDASRIPKTDTDEPVTVLNLSKDKLATLWEIQQGHSGYLLTQDQSRVISWEHDGLIKLWDTTQDAPLKVWNHGDLKETGNIPILITSGEKHLRLAGIVMAHDESQFLSWSNTTPNGPSIIKLWDTSKVAPNRVWQHKERIDGLLFTDDGSRFLSWSKNGPLFLWDVTGDRNAINGIPLRLPIPDQLIAKVALTCQDSRILLWNNYADLKIWNLTKDTPVRLWNDLAPQIHDVTSSAGYRHIIVNDELRVLAWDDNRGITLLDISGNKTLGRWKIWEIAEQVTNSLSLTSKEAFVSNDSTRILSRDDRDHSTVLWDVTTDQVRRIWKANDEILVDAAFTQDSSRVLYWCKDGSIRLRNTTDGSCVAALQHQTNICKALLSPDESHVLSWDAGGSMILWDTNKGKTIRNWSNAGVEHAILTNNGSSILSLHKDNSIKLWPITKHCEARAWQSGSPQERHRDVGLALSYSENHFLSWNDARFFLWDLSKESSYRTWKHNGEIEGAIFTHDDSRILSWNRNGLVQLWDTSKGDLIHTWEPELEIYKYVRQAEFIRDGSQVVVCKEDQVKVFDASLHYESLSVAERITELEVRSASRLDSAGQLVPLKVDEWLKLYRSPEYQAIQEKMKAADRKSALK